MTLYKGHEKEYRKRYNAEHKEQRKRNQAGWYKEKGFQSARAYQSWHRETQRQAVIDALGGKCVRCGFSDVRALQIDHVNGDGHKDKKIRGHAWYYKNLLEEILNGSKRYQLLCANCNWIKRHENREYGRGHPISQQEEI